MYNSEENLQSLKTTLVECNNLNSPLNKRLIDSMITVQTDVIEDNFSLETIEVIAPSHHTPVTAPYLLHPP